MLKKSVSNVKSCSRNISLWLFVSLLIFTITVVSAAPNVSTDKIDYAPSETVMINGTGFNPGEINLTVVRPDEVVDSITGIIADVEGNFTAIYLLDGITGTYTVNATDLNGQNAKTTFTDGWFNTRISSISPNFGQCNSYILVSAKLEYWYIFGGWRPLSGKVVNFWLGSSGNYGVTDSNGIATAQVYVQPGATSLHASFAGDTWYNPSGATSWFANHCDNIPPAVTINQATGQADPTNTYPVNFAVVFTEPVYGFATGDVQLSGTAGATVATVTGSGTNYNVAVSVTNDGTVIATIPQGVAYDAANNWNLQSTSTDNTVTYDKTPPIVDIGSDKITNTLFTQVAATSDTLSGIASLSWSKISGPGTITFGTPAASSTTISADTDGTYIIRLTVTDNAGNSAYDEMTLVWDTSAPTIAITMPSNGANYILNQLITADYGCNDDNSGVATCTGTAADGNNINTGTVGSKSFTVTSTDVAGNNDSLTYNYNVIYNFAGFFSPVDNIPTLNAAKAGQAIPLKWRLIDANNVPVTNLADVDITAVSLTCPLGETPDQIEEYTSGSSGLQNLGDGYYQFNWKTPTLYVGSCKTLSINLGDGIPQQALFEFNK